MGARGRTRVDMSGEVFGRLTVVEYVQAKGSNSFWRCKCECGNYTLQTRNNLIAGRIRSCGCLRRETKGSKHPDDYVGKQIKELTVIARGPYVAGPAGTLTTQWLCRCVCGHKFTRTTLQLRARNCRKHCGCKGRGRK